MSTLYPVLTDSATRLITGDPQAALNLKANLASPTFTGVPLSTTAAGGTNTTQIATTAFVSAAVSLAVTGLLELKGSLDCSTNPNYPSGSVGDAYLVTVAGKIGGSAGLDVDIGDTIICQTDNAGGTQAAVGASWFILEHNLAGALMSANNLSDVASNATARTNLGLGTLATQSGTFSGTSSNTNTGDVTLAGENYLSISAQAITAAAVNLSGTHVTGTLADARFPATLPALSGVNLTALNATNLASGTLSAARMPALTGDVTTVAGAVATTIGALKVTNAMLEGSIAYSKLTLTGAVLNADLAGSIAASKLVGTDIDTVGTLVAGAIPTTLLTGTITNAQLDGSIAASKLVGTDIDTVGTVTAGTWSATIITTAKGGTGVDNSTGGVANQFWARPNGLTGAAAYREIVAADIPTLNQSTTGSAATLTTPRAINGTNFDGSAAITVAAAAGTLTGATLASNVLASSLTSVGTLAAVAITGGAINGATVGATTPATGAFTSLSSTIGANFATSSGNVGIGMTSPIAKLQIAGTGTASIQLGSSATVADNWHLTAETAGVGTRDFTIWNGNYTSGAQRLTILSGGATGIGTSAPLSKLGVAGSASVGATYGEIAAPTSGMIIEGNVGIGTSSPNANAILDVTSTSKAFMPPRMTTTQKNAIASPTAGMVVYDSTLNKLSVRAASAWETVTSV